jgi:hypothetical protein
MYKVEVQYGQNIWDIAMQEYGEADAVIHILRVNNFDTLDKELEAGQMLLIDETKVTKRNDLKNNNLIVGIPYRKILNQGGFGFLTIDGINITIDNNNIIIT